MQSEQVRISSGKVEMEGVLWLPQDPVGVILTCSGGMTSRVKPPGDYVASVLRNARLGTLWLDLLTAEEHRSREARNDVGLMTQRLDAACDWLRQHAATCDLPTGLFGSGDGAAAALQLAVARGRDISAMVLRSGRPEPAGHATLGKVTAPTLLIVGSLDDGVIGLNRAAYAGLRCKKRFEVIPGATHAFDEPGSLEVVARLARGWFMQHAHFVLA